MLHTLRVRPRYAAVASILLLSACSGSGSGGIGAVSCGIGGSPTAAGAPARVPMAQLPSLDTDALLAHT
jgi:hypothetical protein